MKDFKIYVLMSTRIPIFPLIFLNVDNSFDIVSTLLKFSVVVLNTIMEGTVSQIIYLGFSFCFM